MIINNQGEEESIEAEPIIQIEEPMVEQVVEPVINKPVTKHKNPKYGRRCTGRPKKDVVDSINDPLVTADNFKMYLDSVSDKLNSLSSKQYLYGYGRFVELRNQYSDVNDEERLAKLFLIKSGKTNKKGKTKINPNAAGIIKHFYNCFKHLEKPLEKPIISKTSTRDKIKFIEDMKTLNLLLNHHNKYIRIVCRMLYEPGLRRSELINLKKKHIDLEECNVFAKELGKGGKDINVFFSKKTSIYLKEWLIKYDNDEYIFRPKAKQNPGVPLEQPEHALWSILVEEGKKLGIDLTPHVLRHCLGHNLRLYHTQDLEQIRAVMRHEDIETTQIYTKSTKEEIRTVMDKFLNKGENNE